MSQAVRKVVLLKPKVSPGPIKVVGTNSDPTAELEKHQAYSSEELMILGVVDGRVYPLGWWEEKLSFWHLRTGWYKATPQVLCIVEDALAGRMTGKTVEPEKPVPEVSPRIEHPFHEAWGNGRRPPKYEWTRRMLAKPRESAPDRSDISAEESSMLARRVLDKFAKVA